MKSIFYSDHSWKELELLAREDAIVILPIGSTEQHGPHMGICTDDHMALRWAEDAATRAEQEAGARVLVLPGVHYGNARHHMRFPGTITLSFETLKNITCEITESLIQHGFRKIVLLNVHGGNRYAVRAAAVDIYMNYRDGERQLYLRVAEDCDPDLNPLVHAEEELSKHSQEARSKTMVHAGALETAKMLHLKPEVVDLAKCANVDMPADTRQEILGYDEKTPTGSMGKPGDATAEAGRIMWESLVSTLTKYLIDLYRAT